MRRVGSYKGYPLIEAEGVGSSLAIVNIVKTRWVPRGQVLYAPGTHTVYVNPIDWAELFRPPGWSRYTLGEREIRRDRSLQARRPTIRYATP